MDQKSPPGILQQQIQRDSTIFTLNGSIESTSTLQQQIQRTVQFIHLMDQKGPPVHYNIKYKGTVKFIR